ncbi:TPA_exp: Uncharacterized protein A8136_1179 [Trichophyton benhamiae CBS 112371]|uniref:Uncharacterized protein n=1 Tax=Arthroderma benhamiae (strain ATCC MYA-4681 / CBS 112371) TaxID=663331 RepID=D4AVF8_ARTBC|nr:uncharacterized protein ARB_00171 [Trichophyton benhamiae CBS 112371]EFE33080.1 hypothetical protein ARB_00171 [Trichophyton benhamiae CBS 112371]DAA76142.1 TPA_exp: Uncharacterized protein A8136_1179 [Trichophyton benhamiae CBS 112371]
MVDDSNWLQPVLGSYQAEAVAQSLARAQEFDLIPVEEKERRPSSWTIRAIIRPEEPLYALVVHHTITSMCKGEVACWTYISQGMERVGQKEVVFTVSRNTESERKKDFPNDPLRWIEIVYSMAKGGCCVGEFEHTDFQVAEFLGRSDVNWIVYCPACPIPNVDDFLLPQDYLQAIPLLVAEAEVAEKYGLMRTLGHLGASERWFPWPPWFDRYRKPCITAAQMQGSIKEEMEFQHIKGLSCIKKGSNIILRVPKKSEPLLVEALLRHSPDQAFPLNTVHHINSDSGLLWDNRDPQPRGYSAGNSNECMNLNYFAFCPGHDVDELVLIEDGYMSDETWLKIRSCIKNMRPCHISLPELQFLLRLEKPSVPGYQN